MAETRDADQMLMQSRDWGGVVNNGSPPSRKKSRSRHDAASLKRRCVSTACIACRKRKSKCDGNIPSCAACSIVYGTGKEGKLVDILIWLNTPAQNAFTIPTATIEGRAFIRRRSIV